MDKLLTDYEPVDCSLSTQISAHVPVPVNHEVDSDTSPGVVNGERVEAKNGHYDGSACGPFYKDGYGIDKTVDNWQLDSTRSKVRFQYVPMLQGPFKELARKKKLPGQQSMTLGEPANPIGPYTKKVVHRTRRAQKEYEASWTRFGEKAHSVGDGTFKNQGPFEKKAVEELKKKDEMNFAGHKMTNIDIVRQRAGQEEEGGFNNIADTKWTGAAKRFVGKSLHGVDEGAIQVLDDDANSSKEVVHLDD